MQTIGERLEDARKRKGISLREAAEAIKIRSDFLSKIEQNQFDFDLPEIYKRGFIKNYARYLKLDPDKIVTDFSAQQLGNNANKKGGAEWFGTMEIQPAQEKEADEDSNYGSIKTKKGASTNESSFDHEAPENGDKMFYLKAGLIFIGIIVLAFLLFGLVRAILGNSAEKPTGPELRSSTVVESGNSEFKLIASGTVFVAARQLDDLKMLFQGTLTTGEEISLKKKGPVEIVFTTAENITVNFNGESIRPQSSNSSGSSKIKLP